MQRAGQVLDGRYEISVLIGRGAMADVYRARDHRSGRDVAIKILRLSVAREPEAIARFKREARVQAMVRHRNVAALYGGGVTPAGEPYLVFELLRGSSLRTLLRKHGPMRAERAAAYCIQALDGLTAVHALGIHHRDLKPANLMLEPDDQTLRKENERSDAPERPDDQTLRKESERSDAPERPDDHNTTIERLVLIDFGFAWLEGDRKLTRQGYVVGSLSYLAPELLRSEPCDERAEIYAMGIIFYELCAGRPPFVAPDDQGLIHAHLSVPPVPPSQVAPQCQISATVEAVLLACLAKNPEERPQSAAALGQALRHALVADGAGLSGSLLARTAPERPAR